jgi:hypothetical protein
MLAASVDWTTVITSGIAALASVSAALVSALVVRRQGYIRRELSTPSGNSIGQVAEEAHTHSATAMLALAEMAPEAVKRAAVIVDTQKNGANG